ncbi:MAG: GNAT family N-acetyltransferase [Burkholderiaceae bacterium]|nr:GNAT family N-acetyltransferase [Burkholderiaceae bacterium]
MAQQHDASETLPPSPGEPPRVRAARIFDWPRLVALAERAFPTLDPQQLSHWLCHERHSLAVAITSQGLIGLVRLQVLPGRRVTRLELIGVDPRSREQGVGSALLRYAADVACACGAPRLETVIDAQVDPVLQAFLTHHGFVGDAADPAEDGRQCLRREVPAPVWPMWELRRPHAPRVPPAILERAATRVLFDAWLGRSLRQRYAPRHKGPGGQPTWRSISSVAGGSAGA